MMPVYAAVFVVVTLASIGVPGTNGFVGEFMVITGTFISERLGAFAGVDAAVAAAGVISAAVYMLASSRRCSSARCPTQRTAPARPQRRETWRWRRWSLLVFVMGLFPNVFLDRSEDAVGASTSATTAASSSRAPWAIAPSFGRMPPHPALHAGALGRAAAGGSEAASAAAATASACRPSRAGAETMSLLFAHLAARRRHAGRAAPDDGRGLLRRAEEARISPSARRSRSWPGA